MLTTLNLDDDVIALLRQVRPESETSLSATANDVLRSALQSTPFAKRTAPYRTQPYDPGKLLIKPTDSVSEMLAAAEGEDYR